MKFVGILIGIIIAWAVRMACGWIAAKFGTEVDAQTQTEAVNWITAGILAAVVAAVEVFERFIWPKIKAKILAWWEKK